MVALFAGLGAEAALVLLAPDADEDIRSMDLADTGYNRETLSVVNGNADPALYRDVKAYIRCKLPDDFGMAASATFTMVRATMEAWKPTYNVNGLNEGVSRETDWIEANTTGYVTLRIGRMGCSSTRSDSFALRTHATCDAPSLDLEYTVIPEPATQGLILTTGFGPIVIWKRIMI